jgi:hypothetical protein
MAYNGSELYYEGSSSDTATAPHRFKQKQGKKNTLEERVREYTGYLQVGNFFPYFHVMVGMGWLVWLGYLDGCMTY